ncbi:MAG: ASCH domain-containing protein [Anaerolineae bacterium]|nr:ASCH domain-containing protein [Anaerolineae bacterium]
MPIVKAITLYQPWASLIILGFKRFETRSWGSQYTGLLVIHAGKTLEVNTADANFMNHLYASGITDYRKLPLSAAVGVVWKGKCYRGASVLPHIDEREKAFGNFNGPDRIAWELANPVAFDPPVPMRGKQGLWDWPLPLPDDVLAMLQYVI